MKKLYFFVLAAFICLSAMPAAAKSPMAQQKLAPTVSLKRAAAAQRPVESRGSKFDGTYFMTVGDYYFSSSVGQTTIEVEVAVSGDTIYISDPSEDWFTVPVKAPFDEASGVISFEPYVIFDRDDEIDMFVPTVYITVADKLTFTPYQATYNEATTEFVFPKDCGFSWPAWKGANAAADAAALNYDKVAGWYGVFDVEALETGRDYVLSTTTDYVCPAGAEITVNMAVGKDIAKVYCVAVAGQYSASEGQNGSLVVKLGQEVPAGTTLTLETPDENGLYSYMFAGLNAAGRLVAASTTYQVIDVENDADWEPVADTKTVFTDGFITDLFGFSPEDIDVELQQSKTTPGRFRFEAPYAKHSKAPYLQFVEQKNYIYVNATDNLRVYVEPSALGFTVNEYGSPYVFSWPALTAGTSDFDKEKPTNFGRYINGKITAPAVTSFNNEPYTIDVPSTLTLTLTDDSALEEIAAGPGRAIVYDLQGRRVAATATRGLRIINGKKTFVK